MHWNVAPDALPGSVTLERVLDYWLNDSEASLSGFVEFAVRDFLLKVGGTCQIFQWDTK